VGPKYNSIRRRQRRPAANIIEFDGDIARRGPPFSGRMIAAAGLVAARLEDATELFCPSKLRRFERRPAEGLTTALG
jgi:hypothetical protein